MSHDHSHTAPPPDTHPISTDRASLRGLIPDMMSAPAQFILVVLTGTASVGLTVAATALGAALLGGAIEGQPWSELVPVLWWFIACALAGALMAWWQSDISHTWAFSLLKRLRMRIFDGLERATPRLLLGKRTGDLTSTVINDVNATELFFAHLAGDYLALVVVAAIGVTVIAVADATLAGLTLIVMILIAIVPFLLAQRAGAQAQHMRADQGALTADVLDGVQGLRELAAFDAERSYLDRVKRASVRLRRSRVKYERRATAEIVTGDLLLSLGSLSIVLLALHQHANGMYSIAGTLTLIVLALAAIAPVATVSAAGRQLGDIRAAASRILQIADYPDAVPDHGTQVVPGTRTPRLTFEHVRFGYKPDEPVLRDVSFTVEPGETVALVGASGAGKTSTANLLLRFWDPDYGRITVNGVDIKDIPIDQLRALVTLVPQDSHLFNMSVAENIRLGRPEATDDEVREAARLAAADRFINSLPDGYDAPCGERGTQLSGGQRQRIALARALLKDAPLLVLDEAVSSLDATNEEHVHKALARARQGRSVLTIAHRLSTIHTADRIVILDGGAVADAGTYSELLDRSAVFRDIIVAHAHDESVSAVGTENAEL